MNAVTDSQLARWILLLTLLASIWGLFAYKKMNLELLPATQRMALTMQFEALGLAPEEIKKRIHKSVYSHVRGLGVHDDLVSSYFAHGSVHFTEIARLPEPKKLRDALQTGLNRIFKEQNIQGKSPTIKLEPLVNLEVMRLGFPNTMSFSAIESVQTELRKINGISSVQVTEETTAWTKNKAFKLGIIRMQAGDSLTKISQQVRDTIPKNVAVLNDDATYVLSAQENLMNNVYGGTLLTMVCVFAFIRRFGATVIVGLSIPLCALLTIPFLFWSGVTNNIMSMAGLALSVGIVVDATLTVVDEFAILMKTKKYLPIQAAKKIAKDSFGPLFVATCAASAVFVPILFLDGRVGELFTDLAKAVVISNFVGLGVSLIAIPALLALVPHRPPQQDFVSAEKKLNKKSKFLALRQMFDEKLGQTWALVFDCIVGSQIFSFLFVTLSFAAVLFVMKLTPLMDFLPPPKQGIGVVEAQLPSVSSLKISKAQIETIANQLIKKIEDLGGSQVVIQLLPAKIIAHFKNQEFSFSSLEKTLLSDFPAIKFYAGIDNPLKPFGQQDHDLSFFLDGKESNIRAFANEIQSANFGTKTSLSTDSLEQQSIHSATLTQNQSAIVTRPQTIHFWNKTAVVRGLSRLNQDETGLSVNQKIKEIAHRNGLIVKETQSVKEATDSMNGLAWCLLAAIGIISTVLWLQKRSVSRSFVILATFLWAPLGAIPGLVAHGESLNGSALVGFILLAGTIVNNGILLMDKIEKNVQLQMSPLDAARLGVKERFLNVIVTGLTTILAMIPMIFGGDEGAQMYKSLSVVVVYGTIASTPITFIGIPALLTVQHTLFAALENCKLKFQVLVLRSRVQV